MHPLDLDGTTLRDMTRDVLDRLVPWLARMPSLPVARLRGARRTAAAVRSEWPESGTAWRALLPVLDRALSVSLQTTSPGYLGYIPGGGLPHAAVAELYVNLINRYTGLWMPAPGFVQLEMDVLRWFCDLVGYGPGSGGLLTTGGSLANLAAVVAAREDRLGDDRRSARIYVTAATHHSVAKAAHVAGFSPSQLVVIPVDAAHRMAVPALRDQLAADVARDLVPFLVVASAGTTAVGAVDPLADLADVAAAAGAWLHVDGAYGGFFQLTARGRAAFAGLERADSIALDPHKGLFLPYGTGCLVVKRLDTLRRAHTVASSYLPPPNPRDDAWDFADLGPELSRDARGLRVWLPLRMLGFGAFRDALDEKLDLARRAADGVRALPQVRLVSEPVLSVFAFRAEPPGLSEAACDRWNRQWLSAVNQRGRVFLTGATVWDPAIQREIFVLRVAVLCFRTDAARIEALLCDLRDARPGSPAEVEEVVVHEPGDGVLGTP